jgi:glycerophosphoryl diester phosphodiesterase
MKHSLGLVFLLLAACATPSEVNSPRNPSSFSTQAKCADLKAIEIHAHRGAWDHPENMMTAFLRAVDQGADFVEMDLQISQDDQIVVAHDAYMKRECRDSKNNPVPEQTFYRKMTLEKIKTYDCGSVVPRGLPVPGEKISTLAEVLEGLRNKMTTRGVPIKFNIEIKYNPTQPEYYPAREFYVDRILEVIEKSGIEAARIMIQSFDVDTLKVVRLKRTDLRLSPLLSDAKGGVKIAQALKAELVTPHFSQVSPEMLAEFHAPTSTHPHGIKVVPWTVNDPENAGQLLQWGVDGLITDNPEWLSFAKGFCGQP